MLSFIRFLRGCVYVYLSGFAPERFMNLCNNHHINLWGVAPYQEGYQFYIGISDFYRSKEFLKKTKTTVVIRKKLGLPFLLYKYRKRKIFFIGLIFCFIVLFFSTQFLWSFKIEGNRELTRDMYLNFLAGQDISYGKKISDIDIELLEKNIREQYGFITWAAFEIDGTKLLLKLKEDNQLNQVQTEVDHSAKDLCASVSGTVTRMVTRSGTPCVAVGDMVEAGDILISGTVPIYNDDETLRTVHETRADGDVVISFITDYNDMQTYRFQYKKYTGNTEKFLSFGLYDKEFLIGIKNQYKNYDIYTQKKFLLPSLNKKIPVFFGETRYLEYVTVEDIYDKDACLCVLNTRFLDFCKTLNEKGVQIIKKDVKINYKQDGISVHVRLCAEYKDGVLTDISRKPGEN